MHGNASRSLEARAGCPTALAVHRLLNFARMLASILKEHQAKQTLLKQSAAAQHKQLNESIDQLGLALEQTCDALVAPAQLAQSEIERESQVLGENAAKFARQTAKWASVIGSFNEALKVILCCARTF